MEAQQTPPAVQINDIRAAKDFGTMTFSGYKKTEVVKSLMKALVYSKIEPAFYWCAELVCSGHFAEIWGVFIQFYCKYIHIGNAKIAVYLEHKHRQFEHLRTTEHKLIPLQMRNDPAIRRMFAEIICILTDATRKHAFGSIKIGSDDFDMSYMKTRFKAPSTIYAEALYHPHDPSEFIVAINELAYHLSATSRNTIMACYWIEWIYGFESLGKTKGQQPNTANTYECETRNFAPVEGKYQKEIVWLIWDAILSEASQMRPLIQKMVESVLYMFCIDYTKATYKRRKYMLYFAVNLICEPVSLHEDIVPESRREKIAVCLDHIDLIYKDVKRAEQAAGVEYLLQGLDVAVFMESSF